MKKSTTSKSKRWFVTAAGWGLSLTAGSGTSSLATNDLKKRSLPMGEADKVYEANSLVSGTNLTHNAIYVNNITSQIIHGTAENQRIGSTIKLKNVAFRVKFSNTTATNIPNAKTLRIIVFASTYQDNTTGFASGSLGSSQMFYSSGSDLTIQVPNPRLVKVYCDQVLLLQPFVDSTSVASVVGDISCAIDTEFEYQTNTSFGQVANLYAVAIPFESGGTPATTKCGEMISEMIVTYTDTS